MEVSALAGVPTPSPLPVLLAPLDPLQQVRQVAERPVGEVQRIERAVEEEGCEAEVARAVGFLFGVVHEQAFVRLDAEGARRGSKDARGWLAGADDGTGSEGIEVAGNAHGFERLLQRRVGVADHA